MKKNVLWIVIVAIIILGLIAGSIIYLNQQSKQALALQLKADIVERHFKGDDFDISNRSIVMSSGGYDKSINAYHYEFIWHYSYQDQRIIIYDNTEDLTEETVDLVEVHKSSEYLD